MTDKRKSLDELFSEEESLLDRRRRERAAEEKAYNERPDVVARRKAEIEKEIRQGLRDADGQWIDPPEPADEPDEDEGDEDDPDEDDA